MMTAMRLRSTPRFPHVAAQAPHYESFYLKAAHPGGGVALWIRHTVLKAPGHPPIASVWLTLFDRADGPKAFKSSHAASRLSAPEGAYIAIGECLLRPGRAEGAIAAGKSGAAAWRLTFDGRAPEFQYLPRPWMYERALPRTKAISLYPAASFSGRLELAGLAIDLDRWPGMIGHNWGQEHPHRGIWLQGAGFSGDPASYFDGVAGRIKLGPVLTPWIANACLSLDGRLHRLGGLRPGAASISESTTGARFALRGVELSVEGEVSAPRERFVGWRYGEPAGGWHPTLNCSIADMRLVVSDGSGTKRDLSLSGGAAYELQLREHDHGVALQPFADP